jgi:hypothetical protein
VLPGVNEHNSQFWEVCEGYAQAVIERAEFNLEARVDGTQLPFAP